MCTTFVLPTPAGTFAGRNLDLPTHFGERVVLTPRAYPFTFRGGRQVAEHEALLGMATIAAGYPLYAEAANESGLYMAGLNFPGYARHVPRRDASGIAPWELIPYVLTQATSADQAADLLTGTHLTDEAFAPSMPLAPLHFFLADRSGAALVVEQTGRSVDLYDDPAQVLTNSPALPFHLEHLRLFMGAGPAQPANRFGTPAPGDDAAAPAALDLTAHGVGFGGIGLPGDQSPASRFVRAAFLVRHATRPRSVPAAVTQVLRVLDSVGFVEGSALDGDGAREQTLYSAALDLDRLGYYYVTATNRRVTGVVPDEADRDGTALREHALAQEADFATGRLTIRP